MILLYYRGIVLFAENLQKEQAQHFSNFNIKTKNKINSTGTTLFFVCMALKVSMKFHQM